jgi:hypothetical protein
MFINRYIEEGFKLDYWWMDVVGMSIMVAVGQGLELVCGYK